MIGDSWSTARSYGRLAFHSAFAVHGAAFALLAACAAGDPGLTDNPFTTAPPVSDTGTPVTEAAPTEASGTSNGPGSNSDATNSSVTNGTTAEGGDTEPDDPTENVDPDCVDDDDDGFGASCQLGPDCDDADYNNHTPEGCASCVDGDGDNVWTGCDQYGEQKPGPDCDDDNDQVGAGDAVELCNGIAENCAGEIDPLAPEDMCPTDGTGPNVAPVGGWKCNPVPPGEDGCEIATCMPGFYDADKMPGDGCECVGTDRTKSLESCGDDPKGAQTPVAEGGVLPAIKGVIPFVDNGPGMGLEDWYLVPFPEAMAQGARPNAGNIVVTFAVNPGDPANPDYRFEVLRTCNGAAFEGGLATQFGPGAPPAREWTFLDTPNPGNPVPNPKAKNDVPWPEKVYIRVFRVNNNGTCGEYSLQISRLPN